MAKKILRTVLGILLVYGSVAFAIKAGIGVLPVDAAITRVFGVEWTLREGTVIAALMFGPMMDFWKRTVFGLHASA